MSFLTQPVVALFASIAIGYLIGRLRIGPVRIGGVCGTLFVALAIGQLGVTLDQDLKDTAFALFIFALGFAAGPQFFASVRTGWLYGIFSLIEVLTVLGLLAVAVLFWGFDPGTTAGLFAGSATESAVLGTAAEAMEGLGLPAETVATLQGNMATAYSITYLFGLVSIVVFTTQVAPLLLRINLKESAKALAKTMGAEDADEHYEEGLPSLVGRAFRAGPAARSTVGDFERTHRSFITVEKVMRGDQLLDASPEMLIEPDDVVLLIGRRSAMIAARAHLGAEVPVQEDATVAVMSRDVVLLNRAIFGLSIVQLRDLANAQAQRGVFISAIRRLNHKIPILPGTTLAEGDIITLYGSEHAIVEAAEKIGRLLPATEATDYVFLGLGIVAGLLIGGLGLHVGSFFLSLGTGGGALVAGLVFGWLHTHYPQRGAIPVPAAEFMKEFGLATFIAAVGLSTGPDAINLILQFGLILPVLGIVVSVVPGLVSLLVGTVFLKIEAPILLGAIAGQHCSTPAITALVQQSESSIPVTGYTVTYAISNVILPLMGPVVVGMAVALG